MKRTLLVFALSAFALGFFALPSGAETTAPADEVSPTPSELRPLVPPVAPEGEMPTPATPYEVCAAEAFDPVVCEEGEQVLSPGDCPPGGEGSAQAGCKGEATQVVERARNAALMAATEAAAETIKGDVDAVDGDAAYVAALGAARKAAREAGADAGTVETVAAEAAETAAVGAVAEKAAMDASNRDGSSAVEGLAGYLSALGAARGAERDPETASQNVAATSERPTENGEAQIPGYESGVSGESVLATEGGKSGASGPAAPGPSASGGTPSPSADEEAAAEGEETPADDGGAGVVTSVLSAADSSPGLVLEGGALLIAAGVVGLVILRRRMAV